MTIKVVDDFEISDRNKSEWQTQCGLNWMFVGKYF